MEQEKKELYMVMKAIYVYVVDYYQGDSLSVVVSPSEEGYLLKINFSKKIGDNSILQAVTTLSGDIFYFIIFFESKIKEEEISIKDEGLDFCESEDVVSLELTIKVSFPCL